MFNYKRATIWGFVGIVIGICAFLFNYNMVPVSLLSYALFTAPAMFMLSFFSEETYFIPKMILFLTGQFIGYFTLAIIVQFIRKKFR